jgi:anti-sigma regulatory factor (Ser/Thr protein kinase)
MERCQSFDPQPHSVRAARRFVASVLRDTGADPEVAELLTSELATNAVIHASTEFEVRVRTADSGVRVEIVNDEPELLASLRDPDERGGRGLRIIESLAARWGTESDPRHKIVWFEIATD